jgi:hypothetical protein
MTDRAWYVAYRGEAMPETQSRTRIEAMQVYGQDDGSAYRFDRRQLGIPLSLVRLAVPTPPQEGR